MLTVTPTVDRERAQRLALLRRLEKLPGSNSWPAPGYVIDSIETDDHVTHDYAFCYEHAAMVARGDSILTGAEMFIVNVSHSETDCQEYCAFHGCGVELNTGSPTDYWIESALGLTEEDPYKCHVTKYELIRSYWNMMHDNVKWSVWIKQARRTLRRARHNKETPC